MIPNYQITGQSVTPEKIVDIIPEQEAEDAKIQASEERYLSQLQKNNQDKLRNTQQMWKGLSSLSSTLGDYLQKKQE